jgi:hypothetical protein
MIFKFLLSSFKYSQIWLIPLVDDSHCGYITKLKKRKKKLVHNLMAARVNLFLFIGKMSPKRKKKKKKVTFEGLNHQDWWKIIVKIIRFLYLVFFV